MKKELSEYLLPSYYVSGGIVLGFFQFIDALLIYQKIQFPLATAFSLLEMCWFLLSIIYLRIFQRDKLSLLLPGMFTAYYLFGWFYGSYLLSGSESSADLVIPDWYILFAIAFGAIYCAKSVVTYRQWFVN